MFHLAVLQLLLLFLFSYIISPPGRHWPVRSASELQSPFPPLPLSPRNPLVTLSCTAVPKQYIQQSASTCWLTFPSCLPLASHDPQGSQLHCASPGLYYQLASPTLSRFQSYTLPHSCSCSSTPMSAEYQKLITADFDT